MHLIGPADRVTAVSGGPVDPPPHHYCYMDGWGKDASFFGSWQIELVLEQSNPFPIETKEWINITPAQQLKMPVSPLIISA